MLTLGLVAWNRASSDIFQIVGGRGVKAARDVDGSVLPKNDTARVDQVEVGPFDRDWIAPFIDDRLPPRRAFLGCRPEHPKARKQVAADLLAEAGGDRVVRSGERSRRRPKTAIDRDMLRPSRARQQDACHGQQNQTGFLHWKNE